MRTSRSTVGTITEINDYLATTGVSFKGTRVGDAKIDVTLLRLAISSTTGGWIVVDFIFWSVSPGGGVMLWEIQGEHWHSQKKLEDMRRMQRIVGFNAGSNLEANGTTALAFVNTMVATAAAALIAEPLQ